MSSEIHQKISGSVEVEAAMTISSELLNPRSTITVDSILDVVEYIPLETNDSAIIGRIDEIVLTNDLIIILDKTQTESIFLFNRTGDFIAKVNRKGKGPGEYMQPSDIAVDEQLQELYLLNEFPSKVIVYDFEGKFIKEFSLPFRFLAFESMGDNEFVFTNEPNNRKYGNPVGRVNNIFSKLFFILKGGSTREGGGPLQTAYDENIITKAHFGLMKNTEIIYHPLFNDTIFGLKKYESYPLLVVDLENNSIPIEYVSGLNRDAFYKVCAENGFYFIDGQYAHTDEFITFFIRSVKEDVGYNVIYNRKNKDHLIFLNSISTLFNPCNLIAKTSQGKYFVSVVPASRIVTVKMAIETFEGVSEEVFQFTPKESLLDMVDENSNPVLCFFKLRPDKVNMESVYYE